MAAYNGFQLYSKNISLDNLLETIQSVASTQYNPNDALNLGTSGSYTGLLTQVTAAQYATHIYDCMVTPASVIRMATANLSTVLSESIRAVRCAGNGLFFSTNLTGTGSTPTRNGVACNANTSTTTVLLTDAGSTGDLLGGQIYIDNLQQQRTITGDTVAGGVRTITVAPAFFRAPTTGDKAYAVPWSKGFRSVKFNSTTPSQGISTAIADKSGGHINIEEVFLGIIRDSNGTLRGSSTPYVVVSFPADAN